MPISRLLTWEFLLMSLHRESRRSYITTTVSNKLRKRLEKTLGGVFQGKQIPTSPLPTPLPDLHTKANSSLCCRVSKTGGLKFAVTKWLGQRLRPQLPFSPALMASNAEISRQQEKQSPLRDAGSLSPFPTRADLVFESEGKAQRESPSYLCKGSLERGPLWLTCSRQAKVAGPQTPWLSQSPRD